MQLSFIHVSWRVLIQQLSARDAVCHPSPAFYTSMSLMQSDYSTFLMSSPCHCLGALAIITLICLVFPGGGSHQRGAAPLPDLSVGQICDQGGEICHLWLGSLGSTSALHCKLIIFFCSTKCNKYWVWYIIFKNYFLIVECCIARTTVCLVKRPPCSPVLLAVSKSAAVAIHS